MSVWFAKYFTVTRLLSYCQKNVIRIPGLLSKHKNHLSLLFPIIHVQCASESSDSITGTFKTIAFSDRSLTHEHLIQQACSASVNTASQLLTQTLVALIDTGKLYRQGMEELLILLDESRQRTKLNINQNDLNDLLVETRSKVTDLKKSLMDLNFLMENVEKLVVTTAEVAFSAGAETVCNAMSDRLQSARSELITDRIKIKKLEDDCLKLQHAVLMEEVESEKKKGKKAK